MYDGHELTIPYMMLYGNELIGQHLCLNPIAKLLLKFGRSYATVGWPIELKRVVSITVWTITRTTLPTLKFFELFAREQRPAPQAGLCQPAWHAFAS